MRFIKQGPKNFDDLDILFDKFHVSGATATCPDDVSSDESSDEDVDEVKLDALKKSKLGRKRGSIKKSLLLLKIRMRRIHSFNCTRAHVRR